MFPSFPPLSLPGHAMCELALRTRNLSDGSDSDYQERLGKQGSKVRSDQMLPCLVKRPQWLPSEIAGF